MTTMTRRIQSRARQPGWRKPQGAVYVGRPTCWGNPYRWHDHGRCQAVELYRTYLADYPEIIEAARRALAGKVLACWRPVGGPCHADVLVAVANGGAP